LVPGAGFEPATSGRGPFSHALQIMSLAPKPS